MGPSFYGPSWLFSVFGSASSQRPRTPKTPPFDQCKVEKRYCGKVCIFCPIIRGNRQAAWIFFLANEAFVVAKSALGPHGANPPHIDMHTAKNRPFFFKIRGFHENRVEMGAGGPNKTAGHLQDTRRTHLLLAAAGSESDR